MGAGFTKAVFPNAPLNKDLLPVLCEGTPRITLTKYHRIYKTDDIEILLTQLDLQIAFSPHRKQTALKTVRKAIEEQLAAYFGQFRFTEKILEKNEWLESFAQNVFHRDDVVITTNYDCFLEGLLDYFEMWTPNNGYPKLGCSSRSVPENPHNILIYKVHGSEHFVEALGIPNREKTAIGFPVDESIYPRSGKNRFFNYGMDLTKGPYIIAPSFVKTPHEDIELMMIKALNSALSAKNLIIIGCSLRHEDVFLWLLLTNFLNQPIENRKLLIVDPYAERLTDKIINHYFIDIRQHVKIKTLSNNLEDALRSLVNELHENNTERVKEHEKVKSECKNNQ